MTETRRDTGSRRGKQQQGHQQQQKSPQQQGCQQTGTTHRAPEEAGTTVETTLETPVTRRTPAMGVCMH
jgi:hypothetical protein